MRGVKHTEICFSRVDESVAVVDCKLDNSCNENPPSTPASASGKVPKNRSSEATASGFQTTFEGPLAREISRSASNDLCARAEANAEDMYQLKLELEESSLATVSACCKKAARDLRTTSFDCTADEHYPKTSGGWKGLRLMKVQRWRWMWLVVFRRLVEWRVSRIAYSPATAYLLPRT